MVYDLMGTCSTALVTSLGDATVRSSEAFESWVWQLKEGYRVLRAENSFIVGSAMHAHSVTPSAGGALEPCSGWRRQGHFASVER